LTILAKKKNSISSKFPEVKNQREKKNVPYESFG